MSVRRIGVRQIDVRVLGLLLVVVAVNLPTAAVAAGQKTVEPVSLAAADTQPGEVRYSLTVEGQILTPSEEGDQAFDLKSEGGFQFRDYPSPTKLGGPFTIRSVRHFQSAGTATTVGKEHTTRVSLGPAYRTIHVFGSDSGLTSISPRHPLPRKQLDLLQMPFDPLACRFLLPATPVGLDDRWNTDSWVVPMATGIDVVVNQKATCRLAQLSENSATIKLTGAIEGATLGSATTIRFSGTLEFDRVTGILNEAKIVQEELRTAGPVSPGLKVTATVQWSQTPVASDDARSITSNRPTDAQQLLLLQTPLRLQLLHSREWHLFHETSNVIMLRQLREGNLISQCNVSHAVTVPPGQHTPDAEFLADVTAAVKERRGTVVAQDTVRDDAAWRVRHVEATGQADREAIIWDYYLCTAASGHQFSLVFSHAKSDDRAFGDSDLQILKLMQLARKRPALPFR